MLHEALRSDHLDTPGIRIRLGGNAEDATEVVDMAVRVDDSYNSPVTAVRPVKLERRGGRLGRDEGVDHNDPGVAFDEGDVREVEAADLVDALHHFVKALLGDQTGLPPEARVDGDGGLAAKKRVFVVVPHHPPVGCVNDGGTQGRDESACRVFFIGGVRERQRCGQLTVGSGDGRLGWFVGH